MFLIFLQSTTIDFFKALQHNWYWGILGAVIAGAFMLKNVFSQPSSPRSKGSTLLLDILWPGLLYGMMDSILLSVIPVMALRLALFDSFWNDNWFGEIIFGGLALLASLLVTTAYHWGFSEFRGKRILWPNIGNGVLTIAYLLTMNPLAAIIPHMAMHVAAMIHGKDTTEQVPPHYNIAHERAEIK